MTHAALDRPAEPPPTTRLRGRAAAVLLALVAVGAIIGATADWILWEPSNGILVTLVAVPVLALGGIVALLGRGWVRTVFLALGALGLGLVAGQVLGPSREPLLVSEGTVTVSLVSPVTATATGPVTCTNVASGSEHALSADPNMRLESPERPFLTLYTDSGGRWAERRSSPRNNGVRFELVVSPQQVPADDGPQEIRLSATEGTTLVAEFRSDGGTIAFDGLAPDIVGDAPLALAGLDGAPFTGTVEWSCG